MNEIGRGKSSSLVVAEKRPQRPGGCGGIFFQLFQWNRNFARKLLFSKKLLPPARPKQAYKKKMPMAKLLLIADENSGGFPNAKKNGFRAVDNGNQLQTCEMRSPSLVARLMGLESMPVVQPEKSRSETHYQRDERFVNVGVLNKFPKEYLGPEKESRKTESRPQKIQKTGFSERRAVSRFGADALQLKSVLTCSRKHHTKLACPLKSPRSISGKNSSRLIGAATKILEPGLQARNRRKYALAYPNHMSQNPKDEVMTQGEPFQSTEPSEQSGYQDSGVWPLKEQSSCSACSNLGDTNFRKDVKEEQSSFSPSSLSSRSCNSKAPVFSIEQETGAFFPNIGGEPIGLTAQAKDSLQMQGERTIDRKPSPQKDQTQGHMGSQDCKHSQDASFSSVSRHRTQNHVSVSKDKNPPRSNLCNLQSRRVQSAVNTGSGSKEFVSLNCSLNVRAKPRAPIRGDSCNLETGRNLRTKQDNFFSQLRTPTRKRRTTNIGRQAVDSDVTSSTFGNQRNATTELASQKEMGPCASLVNQHSWKNKLANQRDKNTGRIHGKSTDVVSFMFSSPLRQETEDLSADIGKINRNRKAPYYGTNCQQKKLMPGENDRDLSFVQQMLLEGDALGSFLEKKLKELSDQEEQELCGNRPTTSAAMILQELISVLGREMPIFPDAGMGDTGRKETSCCRIEAALDHEFLHYEDLCQTNADLRHTSNHFPDGGFHFSPGSVLEASFSSSCFSSSLDDNSVSGIRVHPELLDYSSSPQQLFEPDSVLVDSANSLNNRKIGAQTLTQLINQISGIIYSIGVRLTGIKLSYAEEIILIAELLFGNASVHRAGGVQKYLLGPLLLDKLETLCRSTFISFSRSFGKTKEGDQLRAFLLDCTLEFLDKNYVPHSKLGYVAWQRFQLSCNMATLIHEVIKEMERWTCLAGKLLDEIIDSDMSSSLGKWSDFEIEAFEISAEIGGDILLNLMDEIMADICWCRTGWS